MRKLDFEQFKDAVVSGIKEFLPENFEIGEIKVNVVTKNNGVKITGLTILRKDSMIAPTLYLEPFYSKYEDGETMRSILTEIAKMRTENDDFRTFDASLIDAIDNCKNRILPRLIGVAWNKDLLNERPHIIVAEDLAVTFAVELGAHKDGCMSIPIHNQMAAKWKVTADELYKIALHNLEEADCGVVISMRDLLRGNIIAQLEEEFDCDRESAEKQFNETLPIDNKMFVVTNKEKTNGACMILDKKTMQRVRDLLGSDFYILPSSIHECIVVPIDDTDADYYRQIVMEVNSSQVALPERLSDNVYRYTPEDGLIKAD